MYLQAQFKHTDFKKWNVGSVTSTSLSPGIYFLELPLLQINEAQTHILPLLRSYNLNISVSKRNDDTVCLTLSWCFNQTL